MHSVRQDKAFDQYLESSNYDEAEAALFRIIREAYQAGWRDALAVQTAPREPDKE